ncbi:MAG: hypothetical protein MR982_10030 [Bacteroides pyogenes]|uniref:hypothetical protein n=1 Tax=Bacteroides pyogenes TaxID=310300 RepID=UPI00242CB3EE|nr:hypothetical protein [Bacteroides pyogenes]MCI7071278.1 hypothetical protein [Bacteroides pyogenes]
MEGLFIINDKDMFKEYGVFLTEDRPGNFFNLSELLKPAQMKPYMAVSFREEDGEKLPEVLPAPRMEPRDFTLYVAMIAQTPELFTANYSGFMGLIKSGWLTIRVSGIDKNYKVYYQGCSFYAPLTETDQGEVITRMKLKFREPQPTI